MKYNELFFFITIIIILFIIYKSRINIIFILDIDNNKPLIILNGKYLFNIINVKVQIYPPKHNKKQNLKKNKQKENSNKKLKILKEDILYIIGIIKRSKVKELYSDISFGNKNIYFTSFLYIFINSIYGSILNIIDAKKIHLAVKPNYTDDFIKGNIRIHISFKIEDFFKIGIRFIKIYRNSKDGGNNETYKYTKSYGDNA